MNAGKLNKRIIILEQSQSSDSYGELENRWVEKAIIWASVKPLQGREFYQAKQVHAELTVKVIIRYCQGIRPDMRIGYGERTLEIISIINIDESNRFLEISCKESI